MSAKILQIPQIISIVGSTIRVAHPSIEGMLSTQLISPIASGGTTMSVADNNGLVNGEYLLVGKPGNSQSELVAITGAITRGSALTVANTLAFGHELDCPITRVYERGIKIYGASSDGGAGTLIASVDSITTPIADAVLIQWDKPYTEYTLVAADTAYNYYYVVFTDGATDSSVSAYVQASGVNDNSVEKLMDKALSMTNSEIDENLLTRSLLIGWTQEAQDSIAQFVYQDTQTGRQVQKSWSFEAVSDILTSVQNKTKYDLSTLTRRLKYRNSDTGIISIRIGNTIPRTKTQIEQYEKYMQGTNLTLLNGASTTGATTLTVDSTADFNDSGTVTVVNDIITYTGKTATTFTGIPSSGAGSITANHADNSEVWQGNSQGLPKRYCIDGEELMFDTPFNATEAGKTIKVRYFAELPRLTKLSDETIIPFYNVIPYFLASQIERRKDQQDKANMYLGMFQKQVTQNALADRVPTTDTQSYYNFTDPATSQTDSFNTDGLNSYYRF